MKKKVNIIVFIFCSILCGIMGFIIGINIKDDNNLHNREDKVIGTYRTTDWNGREAILTINSDKSCKYPNSSDKCEWRLDSENKIIIITPTTKSEWSYIYVTLEEQITAEDITKLKDILSYSFDGVSSVTYDESNKKFKLYVDNSQKVDNIAEQVRKLDKVYVVTKAYGGDLIETTKETEVIIVSNGIVLHDHFFEKLD